jgi:Tol biopolymer transport system component
MQTFLRLTLAVALLFGSGNANPQSQAAIDLEAAIRVETIDGDLEAAIEGYRALADSGDRAIAAEALLRLGGAYEKLGSQEARAAYERVVLDYGDQGVVVAEARLRLNALSEEEVTQPIESGTRRGWEVARRVRTPADGGAIVASVSPDGQLFAFAHWTGTVPGDMAVQDLSTGEYQRLTDLGGYNALNSAISPDSRFVAYSWRNANRIYDLHIVGVDGSEPRVLHASSQYSVFPTDWSAGGTHVLVGLASTSGNRIGVINVSDGSLRALRSLDTRQPLGLKFSRDSRFVAYDLPKTSDVSERDIFLLNVNTLETVSLTEGPESDVLLGWEPDGSRILFARDRNGTMDVWALPVSNGVAVGEPAEVIRDLGQIMPLGITDAGDLYYVRQKGARRIHLATLNPDTGLPEGPAIPVDDRSDSPTFGPSWSRDGAYLAYFTTRDGNDAGRNSRTIVVRSRESGDERVLSPELDYPIDHTDELRWSPDGTSLLNIANGAEGVRSLYTVDVETGAATILVRTQPGELLSSPAWSPDGRALFYVHHDTATQTSRIVRRELTSGRTDDLYSTSLSLLPFRSGQNETMALSPDGQHIAFSLAATSPDSSPLLLLPATGGEPRELLRGQYVEVETWTPDGRVLFTGRPDLSSEPGLWSVGTDDAAPRLILGLSNPQGYPRLSPFGVSVRPDGREIAFTTGPIVQAEVWMVDGLAAPDGF